MFCYNVLTAGIVGDTSEHVHDIPLFDRRPWQLLNAKTIFCYIHYIHWPFSSFVHHMFLPIGTMSFLKQRAKVQRDHVSIMLF